MCNQGESESKKSHEVKSHPDNAWVEISFNPGS